MSSLEERVQRLEDHASILALQGWRVARRVNRLLDGDPKAAALLRA